MSLRFVLSRVCVFLYSLGPKRERERERERGRETEGERRGERARETKREREGEREVEDGDEFVMEPTQILCHNASDQSESRIMIGWK